jgi:hypothetical protein
MMMQLMKLSQISHWNNILPLHHSFQSAESALALSFPLPWPPTFLLAKEWTPW